jgi:hypothetical protein
MKAAYPQSRVLPRRVVGWVAVSDPRHRISNMSSMHDVLAALDAAVQAAGGLD